MMKIILSLLLLLSVSVTLHAQNPIAQLKFEDGEKAFNEGDYEKALHYVEETEALAGVTSKTLYLKIVSQDKLVAGGQAKLLGALKSNVQKYLTALASREINDKYRTVYEISKKLDDYKAGGITSANAGIAFTSSDKDVAQILSAYRKAVTGSVSPASVHSVIVEKELIRNGSPYGSITETISVGKYCMEMKMGVISTKIVYNQGKGYIAWNGRQMPLTQMEKYRERTSSGNLIPLIIDPQDYANATAEKGTYNGEQIDAIKLPGNELYFDRNTHLLIAQKVTKENEFSNTTTFGDYTSFQGMKFPSTTTAVTVITTAQQIPNPSTSGKADNQKPQMTSGTVAVFSKADDQESQTASGTAAVGLLGNRKKKKKRKAASNAAVGLMGSSGKKKAKNQGLSVSQFKQVAEEIAQLSGAQAGGNTTTLTTIIKSVKINEPIPDEVFK